MVRMWKKLSSKVLFEHPRLVVEEDEVQLPSGSVIQYLRYGYGGDGVVIIASNDAQEILFIREYSYIPNKKILQLPMGKIENGEEVEQAANRELQEETDFKAMNLVYKGSYYQNHRRSSNKGQVVMATQLVESHKDADPEEEGIEKVWIKATKIKEYIKNGDIVDADTLSSLALYGFL
jgi:ADP-ribose pyrophosphatase